MITNSLENETAPFPSFKNPNFSNLLTHVFNLCITLLAFSFPQKLNRINGVQESFVVFWYYNNLRKGNEPRTLHSGKALLETSFRLVFQRCFPYYRRR